MNRDTVLATLLGVGLFGVYAAGASPTIYVGDSGELVAAVHVLGIPHPTGYPLYALLGKLWTLLVPIGSIAYRMSLFSAACAAAAAAVLYRCARLLGLQRLAAVLAALLLAFCPSFWGEANIQRVYTLNALFVALATAAALRWWRRPTQRRLACVAFACGVGATNHTFMAIYAAAFALAFAAALFRRARALGLGHAAAELGLTRRDGDSAWRGLTAAAVLSAAAFVAGLLPYLYLPWRSRADPALDWGNPESMRGLLDVVLRRGFWQRAWIEQPSDVVAILGDYGTGLGAELAWAGAALAVLGALSIRRFGWPVLLMLLVMLANLAVMAAHGSRSDLFLWHRYYIPSYAMAALLAGCGAQFVIERLPPLLRLAPLVLPVLMLASGWQRFDRSRYRVADAFSRAVLQSLPPGASLIATDDNILFVLIYLTMVEGLRPDVHLILQGVGGADLPPLHFDPDRDPLFFTHHPNWNVPGLDIVPVGLLFRAARHGQPLPEPVIPLSELPGERDPAVPKDDLTQNLISQLHYMLGFTFEQRDWPRARASLARAAAAAPDNDVLFYNLGLVYQRNGLIDDALAAFRRSHAINPRHLASASRARADHRIAELLLEQQRIAAIEDTLAAAPSLRLLTPGTPPYHAAMAALLETRGESLAARGHRLRALERERGEGT